LQTTFKKCILNFNSEMALQQRGVFQAVRRPVRAQVPHEAQGVREEDQVVARQLTAGAGSAPRSGATFILIVPVIAFNMYWQ
jgi:hypothetical protein